MMKKIVAGLVLLAVLVVVGAFVLLKTKSDVLVQKFSAYVEENTGEPLTLEGLPAITLFPNPGLDLGRATWGREDGPVFVSFDRASVRVSATALLKGNMRILGMETDDLAVTIHLDRLKKQGSALAGVEKSKDATQKKSQADTSVPAVPAELLQSAGPASDQSSKQSSKQSTQSAPVSLRAHASLEAVLRRVLDVLPAECIVRRGRLILVEENATVNTLAGVELEFNKTASGSLSINLTADAQRKPGAHHDAAALNTEKAAKLLLEASAELNASTLDFTLARAELRPEMGFAFDSPLSVQGGAVYHLEHDAITLKNISVNMPDMVATLQGKADMVTEFDPLHKGVATLDVTMKGSPRACLAAFGKTWESADPKALDTLRLAAAVSLNQGHVRIDNLNGALDATTLSGHVAANMTEPALSGELTVGTVNMDALLPPKQAAASKKPEDQGRDQGAQAEMASASKKPVSPEMAAFAEAKAAKSEAAKPLEHVALPWPKMDLTLRMESLTWDGLTLKSLHARLEGKNGKYAVNPLTFRVFGGPVTASLNADVSPNIFPPSPETRAHVNANISATGIQLAEAGRFILNKDILEGQARLNATLSCDTAAPLNTLAGKGSLSAEPLRIKTTLVPPNAGMPHSTPPAGVFDKALLTFSAKKGVISIDKASMTSPKLALNGAGTINLPVRTLDVSGTVQVTGMAVLPVRLSGPIAAPSYSLNARSSVDALNQTLKQHGVDVGKELGRGLQNLFKK